MEPCSNEQRPEDSNKGEGPRGIDHGVCGGHTPLQSEVGESPTCRHLHWKVKGKLLNEGEMGAGVAEEPRPGTLRDLGVIPSGTPAELGASGSFLRLPELTDGAWGRAWPGGGGEPGPHPFSVPHIVRRTNEPDKE